MGGLKQVKVDNWGVFFLQRLKNFFNNTEYCDLTLQFRDCAQLKVHRLVLNACTKYFELLERTCEMYDDCLIMPDDLQADVVVPIVNFMYTGQLEYDDDLFDRLHKTAHVMKMTVLIKLLDSQKSPYEATEPKKETVVMNRQLANRPPAPKPSTSDEFNNFNKKNIMAARKYGPGPGHKNEGHVKSNSVDAGSGRPTRYELPEELDGDEIFDTSFADISYESLARKVSVKRKRSVDEPSPNIYDEASSSRKFEELKRAMYKRPHVAPETAPSKQYSLDRSNESYRQKMRPEYVNRDSFSDDENPDPFASLMEDCSKPSFIKCENDSDSIFNTVDKYRSPKEKEADKFGDDKNSNVSLSHAKIISEVLKKYPHLVKSDKNIKLKIMTKSEKNAAQNYILEPNKKITPASSYNQKSNQTDGETKKLDWIYVSRHDNLESMENLIAMGAENTTGPWLCLICGTPNKAMKFLSYHSYYKHLVDVHKQRIAPKICEYCGFKSGKRNHLLHHMYTKHGIQPPAHYHFPKCDQCSYIALTEAFLAKHVLSHLDNRHPCLMCNTMFKSRTQLLHHIYLTGHKLYTDKQSSTKCVYCGKVFLRPNNLYTHIKMAHSDMVNHSNDFDDNDYMLNDSKYEYPDEQGEEHVKIKQEYDGKIQIISNTQIHKPFIKSPQKLLNTELADKARDKIRGFESPAKQFQRKESCLVETDQNSKTENFANSSRHIGNNMGMVDVVVLNDNEYILESGDRSLEQEIEHEQISLDNDEMILPDMSGNNRISQIMTTSSMKAPQKHVVQNVVNAQNQPVQIVLAGNQQYKTIVSNAQIVYSSNSGKADITDASKFLQGQIENIQIDGAQPGNLMVLNEEDFQMACSQTIPNHGSNIVVVYSHPVQNNKEYIEVSNQEYDNSINSQEHQQMQIEECEQSNILSDHGVVHETVETWQEETIEEQIQDKEYEQENSDIVTVEENMAVDYNAAELKPDELAIDEDGKIAEEEIFHDSSDTPLETTEVEIPLNDSDNPQELSSEVIENGNENMDYENTIETASDVNVICEEPNDSPESGIECIETKNSHDYALQQKDDLDTPESVQEIECVDKTMDLSDNISASKELENVLDVTSDDIADDTPIVDSHIRSYDVEVEESIENIQEEIKKQVQEHNAEEHNTVVDISEPIEEMQTDTNLVIENKLEIEETNLDETIANEIESHETLESNEIEGDNVSENVEHDLSQQIEDDVSKQIEDDVSKQMEDDVSKQMEVDVSKQIEEDASKLIEEDASKLIEDDASKLIEDDASKLIEDDASKLIEDDVSKHIEDDASKLIEDDVSKHIEDDVSKNIVNDKTDASEISVCSEDSVEVEEKQEKKTGIIKSVEKISHLLNEWEDNDSQAEDTMSDTNENMEFNETETKGPDVIEDVIINETVIKELPAREIKELNVLESKELEVTENRELKDSNIEKLVSDWDEEEEK